MGPPDYEDFIYVCSRIFCYKRPNAHDSHNKSLSLSVSPNNFNTFQRTLTRSIRQIRMLFDEDISTTEVTSRRITRTDVNRLTPNDPYMVRTAPLTSKRCILYIYSTNISTEYFKHTLYSRFFSLQNAVCFIMLTCLIPVLFTFYIQNVLKLK